MLCPEVWDFPCPKSSITYKSGVIDNGNRYIQKQIENQTFNSTISIIFPEKKSAPAKVVDIFKDSDHYIVRNISLKDLLRSEFIEGFIKRGKFTALSCDVSNECDDYFAVVPDGILTLCIDKELFQSLGIDGDRLSNSQNKYILTIDLKNSDLRLGTKHYERTIRAFSNDAFKNVSLQFVWEPPEENICPSSIAKYFNDIGSKIELCRTAVEVQQKYSLKFPKKLPEFKKNVDFAHKLVEYVGMVLLSCDVEPDPYVSSYKWQAENADEQSALTMHCKGMFSSEFTNKLICELREHISNTENPSWVALYVHGFPNSPSICGRRYSHNKSNGTVLFLYEDDKYFLYQYKYPS